MSAIDQPGVYDLPPEVYHGDPVAGGSLTATGARKLLPPSCPAKYKAWVDGDNKHSAALDLGGAAHATLLGVGDPIVRVDAANWRTKAARAERDEAYAAGAVPLLAADHELVEAMARALRKHPVAGTLIRPDTGKAEQTLVWQDGVAGVWRRALLDWLSDPTPRPNGQPGTRLIISDYKTTHSADPEHLAKALYDFGYYQQADWYIAGAEALNLADEIRFLMICQEKEPPYLVTVAEPDYLSLQRGRMRNRKALDLYRQCRNTGIWPAYADDVIPLSLPTWADRQLDAAFDRGDYDTREDRER